jgi:hypothetical protein
MAMSRLLGEFILLASAPDPGGELARRCLDASGSRPRLRNVLQ